MVSLQTGSPGVQTSGRRTEERDAGALSRVAELVCGASLFELAGGAVVGAAIEVAFFTRDFARIADEGDAFTVDAGFTLFGAIGAVCDFEAVGGAQLDVRRAAVATFSVDGARHRTQAARSEAHTRTADEFRAWSSRSDRAQPT